MGLTVFEKSAITFSSTFGYPECWHRVLIFIRIPFQLYLITWASEFASSTSLIVFFMFSKSEVQKVEQAVVVLHFVKNWNIIALRLFIDMKNYFIADAKTVQISHFRMMVHDTVWWSWHSGQMEKRFKWQIHHPNSLLVHLQGSFSVHLINMSIVRLIVILVNLTWKDYAKRSGISYCQVAVSYTL